MELELKSLVGHEVRVRVTREAWGDCFNLILDNGHTEELDPEETRKWFKDHGVTNKDGLEEALDTVWNFGEHLITIENFKIPAALFPAYAPQI